MAVSSFAFIFWVTRVRDDNSQPIKDFHREALEVAAQKKKKMEHS